MTPSDVARTAHRYIPRESWGGNFLTEKDPNEMCISCKGEATQRIVNVVELAPFNEFYGQRDFKAFSCPDCGAIFSFTR